MQLEVALRQARQNGDRLCRQGTHTRAVATTASPSAHIVSWLLDVTSEVDNRGKDILKRCKGE